jgi:hypothetical protein
MDKIEIKTFIDLLHLAGAFQSNMQSLKKLLVSEEDRLEIFHIIMNQRHFKFLIRCILE